MGQHHSGERNLEDRRLCPFASSRGGKNSDPNATSGGGARTDERARAIVERIIGAGAWGRDIAEKATLMAYSVSSARGKVKWRASLAVIATLSLTPLAAQARELRVCADPNNLPFSNDKGKGFENKIVDLIAHDLNASVSYTWWAQRRGYIRNTLKADLCDLWPGVAVGVSGLATTEPIYRSSYVFVSPTDRDPVIHSFDDARLRHLTIGVQMIGNDATNTPPTFALAQRGMTNNVRGFMLYGDYAKPNPPASIIDAVAQGKIDVAVVWGPLAGYFAAKEPRPLTLTPVDSVTTTSPLPMAFDIAMGLRRDDVELRHEVNQALARERPAIDAILAQYHVVQIPDQP